jgi:hypothetical protein
MKRLPWKYIAGFFDGEGCIDFQFYKPGKGNPSYVFVPRVRIGLAACGLEVLQMFHNTFGGSLCKRESKNQDWQDSYSWELTGYRRVCSFLRNIIKHLIIKKEQAKLILWLETNFKGTIVGQEIRQIAKEELSAMKRDPHRLSEMAQAILLEMLQSR